MKRPFLSLLISFSAMVLLTGCLALHFEGAKKSATSNTTTNADERPAPAQTTAVPTMGQQLIDLQKAKDAGAITEAEFQAQKAKLLENK